MSAADNVQGEQFMAEHYDTPYASASVGPSGYLRNLVVHHEHRGEGHGHELLSMITADADARGVPLLAHARDELVTGLYAKHGFAPHDLPGPTSLQGIRREPRPS